MKKKILILNTDPMEYSYGGVCPFMRNMHPYLQESFEVEYMVLVGKWRRLPGAVRVKYLAYLWLHRKKLKTADFILSHGPEGSFVASFSGVKYAHVYHGNSNPMTISRYRLGKYFAKMYDKMYERIEKTATLLYTVGPIRNERQKKLYNPLKQDVQPLPTSARKGFIFAGRLESMKNVDRLIRIYAQLPAQIRKENPFYIAGYGTQEDNLRLVVRELGFFDQGKSTGVKREGEVIFLGKIDNTKMMETEANKCILLMASSTEGMPTAIAEAFSVGAPVVSTAVGDIPSVVLDGKNGRLLPLDFKDEDYVAAIMDILTNYERYAQAAYECSSRFNREVITRGVIEDIRVNLNLNENDNLNLNDNPNDNEKRQKP